MIQLTGRTIKKEIAFEPNVSILELAVKHDVDWGFNCKKGTCARCRCYVIEGMEYLSEPNEAEYDRLEPEEIEEGFRLGCQTRLQEDGPVAVRLKTYF